MQRLSRTVTSEDFIELEVASNGYRLTEGSPMKEEGKGDDEYQQARTLTRMSEMGHTAGKISTQTKKSKRNKAKQSMVSTDSKKDRSSAQVSCCSEKKCVLF